MPHREPSSFVGAQIREHEGNPPGVFWMERIDDAL
jgi:hypothetical protein